MWEHGGSDPYYDDSVNLNLLRNHMFYWKNKIEEAYGYDQSQYPKVYFREMPPEIKKGYVVRAAEIRDRAVEILDIYLADANFQYLLCNKDRLTEKEVKLTCINAVLGYVHYLALALKNDDLLVLRGHALGMKSYLESFARCADKVKQIINKAESIKKSEYEQMSLSEFDFSVKQI